MMQPIRTKHTNVELGKPTTWDESVDGVCVTLPVHRDIRANLTHSWYQPSEAEIASILAGAPIRLTVFGASHPPVAINVDASINT